MTNRVSPVAAVRSAPLRAGSMTAARAVCAGASGAGDWSWQASAAMATEPTIVRNRMRFVLGRDVRRGVRAKRVRSDAVANTCWSRELANGARTAGDANRPILMLDLLRNAACG